MDSGISGNREWKRRILRVRMNRTAKKEHLRGMETLDVGMPTLIELPELEDCAGLCREQGLPFLELIKNTGLITRFTWMTN